MKSSRAAAPTAATVIAALVLAGCSLFAPEKAPAGSTPVPVTEQQTDQPPISDAQRQSDIDSCREQARAVARQEQNITADIQSRDSQGAFWDESSDLSRNMDEYEARRRYHRMLEECLQSRGYGTAEQ